MKRELQKVSADGHRDICEVKSFFLNAIQNVFVVQIKFLITDSTKKSRGTDIFGLCFVNVTQRELCCWKNYIQMLNLRMFTLFMAEKYAYAWFNLISCHSVQRKIIKEVKNYSQPLSWCVNCLVAGGSKAKVRSSKRGFVHRSTFHCCCTLVQLCMLQKFEFYPNCRMRKCESVFIKTLRPSWSYSSIGPATF